jgi:hypothetical protein
MRGWLVVAIMGWSASAMARDWKDGCPPYVHLPGHGPAPRAADFGTSADVDAALGPSRFAVTGRLAGVSGADRDDGTDGSVKVARAVLALNFRGPSLMMAYAYGAHDPYAAPAGATPAGSTGGTLMTYVGYRHATFALGDAIRLGASLRIGMGASPSFKVKPAAERTSDDDSAHAGVLSRASPLESETFAFDRPVVVGFEARAELVGCYSPFLSLRSEVVQWRSGLGASRSDNPSLWALPLRIAAGGFVTRPGGFPPQFSVAAEAGFEWRSRALGYHRTGRLRVLFELPVWKLRFGLYASGFAGDAKGAELGGVFSWGFDGGSVLQ